MPNKAAAKAVEQAVQQSGKRRESGQWPEFEEMARSIHGSYLRRWEGHAPPAAEVVPDDPQRESGRTASKISVA